MGEKVEITQDDIKRYVKAQKLKKYKCPISKATFNQNKYGLYRWKASGLPMNKYLEIADNEEKYLKGVKKC